MIGLKTSENVTDKGHQQLKGKYYLKNIGTENLL